MVQAIELDASALDLFILKYQLTCFTLRHYFADEVDGLGLFVGDNLHFLVRILSLQAGVDAVKGKAAEADVIDLILAGEIAEHNVGAVLDAIASPTP